MPSDPPHAQDAQRAQGVLDAVGVVGFEYPARAGGLFIGTTLAQLLGHPAAAAVPRGGALLAWVHRSDRRALLAELRRASRTAGPMTTTGRLLTRSGEWRWYRMHGQSTLDANARASISGLVGDVHQQVLDEVDRARRAQSEFLAHMSHELRTPLYGLIGLNNLALEISQSPTQRRYLEVAQESGRTLLQLIDAVLDFSRIDQGKVVLVEQPFDLPELLAQTLRALAPDVDNVPLALRYDWTGEGSHRVIGDEARVRQIVSNLLANAIKFTASGHVSLQAGWAVADDGQREVSVKVGDTGSGVALERQRAIFDPFVQGDASLTRVHGGVGLGLAIARRLARAMGGDVRLLHSGADGSCFEFRWPAKPVSEAPLPLPRTGGRVWLVNRQAHSIDWMAERLVRLGWTCQPFHSMGAALAEARGTPSASQPDVLLIAQNCLEDGAGLSPLREALPQARLALVVRPVWQQHAIEASAQALGITTWVMPLTPRDLLRLLDPPLPIAVVDAPVPPPAHRGKKVLLVEDNAVNSMIAEAFLRQLGLLPNCSTNGAEAVAACLQAAPALVLMDLQMPVMDGLQATRELRALQAQNRLQPFPIIALSAHAGESDRQEAKAAGVDGYLTKPFLLDDLRRALAPYLPELT